MYTQNKASKTTMRVNDSYVGETIEQKIDRIVNNKEPISDGAPLIYTDRKDGVLPATDIRTDRFELAVEAMDHVAKSKIAKREAKIVELNKEKDGKDNKNAGGEGGENSSKEGGKSESGGGNK